MVQRIGMIFIMLSLVGCSTVEGIAKVEVQSEEQHEVKNEEQIVVYSFTGENEVLSLYNGVIVLSPTQQILYGGELQSNQEDLSNLLNYSMEFFILSDEGKEVLLTSEATDMTEGNGMSIENNKTLPSLIGENIFTTNNQNNIKNNFYFELTVTKTNGDKQSYQIKLDATEVTPNY